nr:ctd kinase subunit alpha [Quercus suber]
MYNRGQSYDPRYGGYPPSQGQYGHHNYSSSGYQSQGPPSTHGYSQQQSGYGYHQQSGSQAGAPYHSSRPSRGFNNAASHSGGSTSQRGGGAGRGRGHFANLSWTPGEGIRGGNLVQPGEKTREASSSATPSRPADGDPEDDDNPFRPPADLRAEDESARKKRKVSTTTSVTTANTVAKGDAEKEAENEKGRNKISFSIKGRAGQNASTEKSAANLRAETSPMIPKKTPASISPLAQGVLPKSKSYVGNTRVEVAKASPPHFRKEIVRKKRLKARPELSEDFAHSESVYYRKTGNESVVGSGTYGKVYKAIHVYTGRMVALKKIRMEGERDGVSALRTRILQAVLTGFSFP